MVTNPERTIFDQAIGFYQNLQKLEIELGGVVINRMAPVIELDSKETQALRMIKTKEWSEGLQLKLHVFEDYQALSRREEEEVKNFNQFLPKNCPVYKIPSFDEGLYDINGLNRLNLYLFR